MRINEIIRENTEQRMPFADGHLVLSGHFEKERSLERNIPNSVIYRLLHKLEQTRQQDLIKMPFINFVVKTPDVGVALSKQKDKFGKIVYVVLTAHETLHAGEDEDVIYLEEDELTEAASSIVYHYTNTGAAARIMTTGKFLLSSSTGTQAEKQYEIPGYPYFLSTSRSKVGDYHNRYVGSSAVMFVLNGAWLNNNYKTRPIDYWDRSWLHSGGTRDREAEDRVYSRTPDITANADSILEVHVLLKEQSENRSPEVRTVLLSAKTQGIPAYLYTDEKAWKFQDKRRAVTPAQAGELLKGPQPSRRSYGLSRNYLEDWLELIYKKDKSELTPSAAKKLRSLIVYGQGYRNEDDGLGVDLSNARKPGNSDYPSAVKINNFMRKNKLATPVDLKNYLVDKWKDLY